MARLYILIFLVQIVLAVCALISCLSAEDDQIRALPRLVWILIILFFPIVGSIAWFLAGRPVAATVTGSSRPLLGGFSERPRSRPLAPDDDPEFLRSLDARRATSDRQMFERWEADLRRREDELRQRDPDDPPTAGQN